MTCDTGHPESESSAAEATTTPDAPPAARWVLLGASNLTRGLATVLATVRRSCPAALDVLAAEGNGRSYGQSSRVLWRELPGILQCGLWPALAQRPSLPTAALLTDIGNDLLYEVPVDQIVRWIDECLARLTDAGARIAMTGLPVANLQTLSERRFLFFRRLFVPSCRLSLEAVHRRAHELNAGLIATAKQRGVVFVQPRSDWYGLDPMHVRSSMAPQVWQTILASLLPRGAPAIKIFHRRGHSWRLLKLRPEQRRLWGTERCAQQPALRYDDGTSLSLY